mmetsp:Transcript_11133/g.38767  ORF Transcript_11133/g.38767 Transcript_11133/m.38767 type:complete len:217 (+) Transcript_11133:903-1553(+)
MSGESSMFSVIMPSTGSNTASMMRGATPGDAAASRSFTTIAVRHVSTSGSRATGSDSAKSVSTVSRNGGRKLSHSSATFSADGSAFSTKICTSASASALASRASLMTLWPTTCGPTSSMDEETKAAYAAYTLSMSRKILPICVPNDAPTERHTLTLERRMRWISRAASGSCSEVTSAAAMFMRRCHMPLGRLMRRSSSDARPTGSGCADTMKPTAS